MFDKWYKNGTYFVISGKGYIKMWIFFGKEFWIFLILPNYEPCNICDFIIWP
jgi:hypothetical protein